MRSYHVETARTEHEVEQLRDWWQEMPITDVDANIDYFLTVVRTDPSVRRPHVMRITPDGEEPVLVVARLVDQRFGATVSGTRTGSITAPALVVSFNGVVGASSAAQHRAATAAVADALAAREADVAVFQKTDRTGELFSHLVSHGSRLRRLARPVESSWTARLPDSWDALLAARSSKSRRQIRFDDNKLRRVYGDRLRMRRLDLPEHSNRLFPDVSAVAARSYQRGLGVSLLDSGVQEALIDLARDQGWLRVWMLYIDERPVAFWWGIRHAGVLSIGSPGYLPEYSKDRVGYYVLRRMLEDAANDPGTQVIDFGTGDADYKERFGDLRSEVTDVLLFARRPRVVAVRTFLVLQERGVAIARAGVAKAGWTEDLRRWWRHRNLWVRAARADA